MHKQYWTIFWEIICLNLNNYIRITDNRSGIRINMTTYMFVALLADPYCKSLFAKPPPKFTKLSTVKHTAYKQIMHCWDSHIVGGKTHYPSIRIVWKVWYWSCIDLFSFSWHCSVMLQWAGPRLSSQVSTFKILSFAGLGFNKSSFWNNNKVLKLTGYF